MALLQRLPGIAAPALGVSRTRPRRLRHLHLSADRHASRSLQPAGQRLCCRLHRHAAHEFHEGQRRRNRRRARHGARRDVRHHPHRAALHERAVMIGLCCAVAGPGAGPARGSDVAQFAARTHSDDKALPFDQTRSAPPDHHPTCRIRGLGRVGLKGQLDHDHGVVLNCCEGRARQILLPPLGLTRRLGGSGR